jgi:hypothetical protein
MLFVLAETLLCSEKKLSPCSSLVMPVETFIFMVLKSEIFKEKVI